MMLLAEWRSTIRVVALAERGLQSPPPRDDAGELISRWQSALEKSVAEKLSDLNPYKRGLFWLFRSQTPG